MVKISCILLLFLLIFEITIQTAFAQNQITVSGMIIDAVDKKPLPYVNIFLYGENIGNMSNRDGYFNFKCPNTFLNDTLVISHIGYRPYSKKLCELLDNFNMIELNQEPIKLAEVVVLPVTGLDIIQEVTSKLPDNYNDQAFMMTGFYRELIREKQDLHKYAEGVISIYRKMGNKDLIKLVKGRSRKNLKAFAVHKNADPSLGGPINCFYRDVTNYKREFFDEDYFKYYDYSIEAITRVNNKPVYVISFNKKPDSRKGRYQGKLYIDRDSKAIIKVEFGYNEYGLKKSQPDPVQRTLAKLFVGLTFETAESNTIVNYIENNGQWYLKSVQYSIVDKLTRKDKVYLYTTEKELVISGIETDQVKAFGVEELLDPKKEFSRQVGEYDENFWHDYNIIKATDLQRTLINDMDIDESE